MVELLFKRSNWRIGLKKSILMCTALVCMGLMTHVGAQETNVIPPGTVGVALGDGEISCEAGSNVESFGFAVDDLSPGVGGSNTADTRFGEATAVNGLNELSLAWEYEPSSGRVISVSSSSIRTNTAQNGTSTMTISFNEVLTNPIITIIDLQDNSTIEFFNCDDTPLNPALVANQTGVSLSGNTLTATSSSGANADLQFLGDVSCFYYVTTSGNNIGSAGEGVTLRIRTCVKEEVPPPCESCGVDETFTYISLNNATGTDAGSTADVNLDGVKVGDATIVESTLSIGGDITGTAFGAFANGNGVEETFLLRIDLCEEIAVQQLDVLGLETNSQVWVGTSLDGSDNPTGLPLLGCGGTGTTMQPTGSMVTNTSASCSNQGNGKYTVGGVSVSTLYFRYTNPVSSPDCKFDKATFRIATCVADSDMVVPECPLTEVTITNNQDVIDGTTEPAPGNTDVYIRDANGVFFASNLNCSEVFDAVEAGDMLSVANVSPCAEIVDEVDCTECTPTPPCTTCADGRTYEYIDLRNFDDASGKADIYLDDVLFGTASVEGMPNVIKKDLNGQRFGALALGSGMTESLVIKLDFCEALDIQQIDVLGLEGESQVWIGTSLSGTDVVGGILDDCGMNVDPGMVIDGTSNTIINNASCSNQGDGNYTFSESSVTTLYFKYENAAGSCKFDKTTYRIGVCVPEPVMAAPACPLNLYTVTTNGEEESLYKDANGNYFQTSICANPVDLVTEVATVPVSACATEVFVSKCEFCFIPPTIGAIECSPNSPVITQEFTVTVSNVEKLKKEGNNEADFNLNVFLFPEGYTPAMMADAYPTDPADYFTIEQAAGMSAPLTKPVLLGQLEMNDACTAGELTVVLPVDFPQGTYQKAILLDALPENDPTERPVFPIAEPTEVIPTMGQWALFILALMMSSLAVARIRQSKNHEVKELA